MLEDYDLDVLASTGFEDGADRELIIWPVFRGETVKHCTGIAVFLLKSFLDHSDKDVLGDVLVFSGIDLNLLFALLWLFGLLLLLLLGNCSLKFLLTLLEELRGLLSKWTTALLEEVEQLVDTDKSALLLLREEVACRRLAAAEWTQQDYVVALLFFESRWEVDLEVVRDQVGKLGLQLCLDIVGGTLLTGDLILGYRWSGW